MAFFSLGPAEMLLLLLFSSGGSMPDAISIFPAEDYFKMRGIETTQEKMFELASANTTTAREHVMQIQALRMLETMNVTGADIKKVREIAAGRMGKDPTGFAQKYAQKVLHRAEGEPERPLEKAKATDAIEWFPSEAKLTGAIDFRLARIPGIRGGPGAPNLWKFLPEKAKREVLEKAFEVIEQTGNVEIYRGSVALVKPDNKGNMPRVYARFTGNFNQEWVIRTIEGFMKVRFEERKGPGGEKYQFVEIFDVGLAFLNNNECLIAAPSNHDKGGGGKMIDEMLEIKAGKKESVLKGKHVKDMIDKVPPGAVGFLAFAEPEDLFSFLLNLPEGGAPKKFVFFVTPAIKALDIQAEAVMRDEEKAKMAVKFVSTTRQEAIQALKNFGMNGFPGVPTDALIQLLESVQVEGKASSVHVRLLLPEALIRSIVDSALRLGARDLEPPPEKK